MASKKTAGDRMRDALRRFGLKYPGAHLKSPWPTHQDLAVNDKTFCYMSDDSEPFSLSCKLPHSCDVALGLPFTKPTAYGLGKAGWVSATPPEADLPPIELFQAWIDESYRAQAPKRLIKELDGDAPAAPKNKTTKKKVAKKSAAKMKTASMKNPASKKKLLR